MPGFLKSFVTISVLSSLVVPVLLSAGQASAQPTQKGTDADYFGAGFAAGVTNGGSGKKPGGDAATFGGNLTGRLKLGHTPLSARTHILWSDETTAIIPQISIDKGIARGTNVYLGAGYSFVEKHDQGKPTPLGNTNGPALTAGVESEVGKNFLIYSNATVGVNTYQNSPASAVSVNGGLGYRFK